MRSKIMVTLVAIALMGGGLAFAGGCPVGARGDNTQAEDCGCEGRECPLTGRHKKEDHHWNRAIAELNLTDKQREEIKKHKYESQRKIIELHSQIKLKGYDLKYELSQVKTNEDKVNGLIAEISTLQNNILKSRVGTLVGFKKLFTAEQWEKIRDKIMAGFCAFDKKMSMKKGHR